MPAVVAAAVPVFAVVTVFVAVPAAVVVTVAVTLPVAVAVAVAVTLSLAAAVAALQAQLQWWGFYWLAPFAQAWPYMPKHP